jgi:hypothetical protein
MGLCRRIHCIDRISVDFSNRKSMFGSTDGVSRFATRLKARRDEYPTLRFRTAVAIPEGAVVYRKHAPPNPQQSNKNANKQKNAPAHNNTLNSDTNKRKGGNSAQKSVGALADVAKLIMRPGQPCGCQVGVRVRHRRTSERDTTMAGGCA